MGGGLKTQRTPLVIHRQRYALKVTAKKYDLSAIQIKRCLKTTRSRIYTAIFKTCPLYICFADISISMSILNQTLNRLKATVPFIVCFWRQHEHNQAPDYVNLRASGLTDLWRHPYERPSTNVSQTAFRST